jgi:cobalt-zinc-cadmium efflux system outer membrane protein
MISRLLLTVISIGLLQFYCNAETLPVESEIPSKLSIQEAIDYAIKNNKQIKALSATLPVTEANLIIAKYRPNPILSSQNELVKQGSLHPAQVAVPLELGLKRHYRMKVAKEQISKTELEIRKAVWETHTQVHGAYSQVAVLEDLIGLAKQRKEFYEKLIQITKDRFEAGDISELDVDRANIELLTAENELNEFQGKLKQAKIDFKLLLGIKSENEITLEDVKTLKPKEKISENPIINELQTDVLKNRFEIAILEKEYGITKAQLKQAKWEIIPNLTIEGGAVKPSVGTNIWGPYLAAQAEIPVFNRKQGEIKRAKAQLDYLEKEEDRLKLVIESEISNALQYFKVREEQLQRYEEKLLGQSKNILELIEFGYQKGKLSLTDVLNAEQKNREVKQAYLQSVLNYQVAFSNLEYAFGVPLDDLGENNKS